MSIFCDEAAFLLVVNVMLNEPQFFKELFLILGNFHLHKILLWYAGKYLTQTGVDNALMKGEVLGKKMVVSGLSGGHYVRSLQEIF